MLLKLISQVVVEDLVILHPATMTPIVLLDREDILR